MKIRYQWILVYSIQFNKKSNQYSTKGKAASDNDGEPTKKRPYKSKNKETPQDSNSA